MWRSHGRLFERRLKLDKNMIALLAGERQYRCPFSSSSTYIKMTTRTLSSSCVVPTCNALVVPLTTIFTQPPGCSFPIPYSYQTTSTTCGPPEFLSVWYSNGFYSPGICPSGYSIGCTNTVTGFQRPSDFLVTPGESAYWCVPR